MIFVGSRSETVVGSAREWALTISFVESGTERLSRVHPAVVLLRDSYVVQVYPPLETLLFSPWDSSPFL